MTLAELRTLKPSTIQERYQIEVAAQVAELNENFQKFFELLKNQIQKPLDGQYNPGHATANTESKAVSSRRTALVEK